MLVVARVEADAGLQPGRRAEVAGHDHDRVAEVDRAPLAVRDPAVVEHLQQQVEDVRVCLLDLVQQDDAEGPPADQFGQTAAVVVPDVARRRADDPAHGVTLLILGHVEPDQCVLGVEQVLRQRLGQLGLADPGRSDEDERADRPGRILEPGASAADRVGHDADRVGLADHPVVQLLLDVQQTRLVVLEHAADRNARHLTDQFGDIPLVYGVALLVLGVPVVAAGLDLRLDAEQLLFDPRGRLVVLALSGDFLLLLQFIDPAAQLDHPRRRRLVVDHEPRSGLIDQVDRLVGQVALGQVTLREPDRRFDGLAADHNSVVGLVAGLQRVEDLDRVLGRRFVQIDGRETPLERRVLLDVPAVLVQRRRADHAQFASRERRLEHVGGIDRAFGRARTDHRVQFVDEQDDLPL